MPRSRRAVADISGQHGVDHAAQEANGRSESRASGTPAAERLRKRVGAARYEWQYRRLPGMRLEPHRLVYIDETAVTTRMTGLRGAIRAGHGCKPMRPSATGGHGPSSRACGLPNSAHPGYWMAL